MMVDVADDQGRRHAPVSFRILLVEDSAFFAAAVRRQIEAIEGVELDHAATLAEARKLIENRQHLYSLAVLDVILPDSTDAEVVDLCTREEIPSLVFTSIVSEDFRERLMSMKVIDYIIKDNPASLSILASVIARILRNRVTKAMIVDDSKTAREYIGDLLSHYQFQVFKAAGGKEALEILSEHPDIRLVVTDYHMPHMNGVEMIRAIRQNHQREELAIVGISAGGGSATAAMFIKHGANDYITKPFLREEFFFRINQNMDTLDLLSAYKRAANHDFLTGLYNRRHLTEVGTKLYASQKRGKLTVAAVLLDLDFFKDVNDRFGHDIGDAALVAVADRLRLTTRETDIVARMGGEEFGILAVNLAPDHEEAYFERLRTAIAELRIPADDRIITVTASLGVCTKPFDSLKDMLHAADRALYDAKAKGRNCVVRATSP
jgi:diguanylate cyclase (GGDEF)-like protein